MGRELLPFTRKVILIAISLVLILSLDTTIIHGNGQQDQFSTRTGTRVYEGRTFVKQHWLLAISMYLASFVGDLFDGLVARKLDQTSEFGGLMDMLTDRLSTLGLLFVLSGDYHSHDERIGFPMYSTAVLGVHHKGDAANATRNYLVRAYYGSYPFFGYLCVGAESTYIIAYVRQFSGSSWYGSVLEALLLAVIPGCVLKQIVNVMQLASACYAVAQNDAKAKIK
eukprot:scaffold5517_cov135-Cylindrotheca_fusiformis.AAC.16